jgi:hypothetical protein
VRFRAPLQRTSLVVSFFYKHYAGFFHWVKTGSLAHIAISMTFSADGFSNFLAAQCI